MASRAEAVAASAEPSTTSSAASPGLAGSVRSALSDLYYHSWRLVPANVVWSAVALVTLVALVLTPLGLLLLPLLALPVAGLFRMTCRIARGRAASFWDSIDAWRTDVRGTLTLGVGLSIAAVVLSFNLLTGIISGTLPGWAFATLAFWGLVASWVFAWTAWPVLCDPARAAWPVRDRLRLAALLALAHPLRLGLLALVLFVLLVASTVALVAILTISVAIGALIAARFVLPAADRLDARLGFAAARSLPEVGTAQD